MSKLLKFSIFSLLTVTLMFLPAFVGAGEDYLSGIPDEDVAYTAPMHFWQVYGDEAKKLSEHFDGNTLLVDPEHGRLALLMIGEKSPDPKSEIVDRGVVMFVMVQGKSAVELKKKWNGNTIIYDREAKLVIFAHVPEKDMEI